MDIVACTDKNYIMPTGVMMYSVCCNNTDVDIVFHIITDCDEAEEKEKLIKTIKPFKNKSVVFYDGGKLDTSGFPLTDSNCAITISTYYRLFVAKLLPATLNKVIYLDVDIIVRQSLLPLWNVNLGDKSIAAVPDWNIECSDFSKRLGYSKEKGYFNAGVLLINLEYWRNHNVLNDFVEYIKLHADSMTYADQDVLNYIFREKKMILPIKYNLQSGLLWKKTECHFEAEVYDKKIQDAILDCTIVHFSAGKPWWTSCKHPFRSSFLKYYNQTLWKNEPLRETRPLKLRIIKFFSTKLRKLKLIPELPPYGEEFISGLEPLD